jgi:hypothetical protein
MDDPVFSIGGDLEPPTCQDRTGLRISQQELVQSRGELQAP